MKFLLIVALCIFILSCNDKKTYYTFQGVTVTRIDGDGESTFFYGKMKEDTAGQSFIKAEYYGRNNGLDAFINFKKDSVVELIDLAGIHLISSGRGVEKLYIGKYFNDKLDILKMSHYPSLVRVSDAQALEEQWYVENKSQVVIDRP